MFVFVGTRTERNLTFFNRAISLCWCRPNFNVRGFGSGHCISLVYVIFTWAHSLNYPILNFFTHLKRFCFYSELLSVFVSAWADGSSQVLRDDFSPIWRGAHVDIGCLSLCNCISSLKRVRTRAHASFTCFFEATLAAK